MATYTPHYNLKKPATSDKIRIADFNGNADTIDTTMYDNASLIAKLKADIGIVENTNTATHNISAGQYVIWNGSLYTASSAISSGATLSSANLTAVSNGGLNALNSKFNNFYFYHGGVSANESFTLDIDENCTYLISHMTSSADSTRIVMIMRRASYIKSFDIAAGSWQSYYTETIANNKWTFANGNYYTILNYIKF